MSSKCDTKVWRLPQRDKVCKIGLYIPRPILRKSAAHFNWSTATQPMHRHPTLYTHTPPLTSLSNNSHQSNPPSSTSRCHGDHSDRAKMFAKNPTSPSENQNKAQKTKPSTASRRKSERTLPPHSDTGQLRILNSALPL